MAEAVITAIKALSSFEPSRGIYFGLYIRRSIQLNVSRANWKEKQTIHIGDSSTARKISRSLRRVMKELQNASQEELAERIGVPVEELQFYQSAVMPALRTVPIDLEHTAPDALALLEKEETRAEMRALLDRMAEDLTREEKKIFEGLVSGQTLNEVATALGMPLRNAQIAQESFCRKMRASGNRRHGKLRERALALLC